MAKLAWICDAEAKVHEVKQVENLKLMNFIIFFFRI